MRSKLAVILTLTVLLVASCKAITSGAASAEAAIQRFHQLYNEAKFDDIWNEAHDKFRDATSKEKYDEFMGAILRKLGKTSATSNNGWKVNTFNLTTSILLSQETTFEHGKGTESFTFEMKGDKAVLVGYNIQSTDLITK